MPREHDAAAIREWLVDRVAEILEVDRKLVDPTSSFTALGLDSLQALGLSGELEDWLARQLPPGLVYEHESLEALAEHLAGVGRAARERPGADLEQDATLGAEVVPGELSAAARVRGPGTILLTGATGHLGAFLLRELMETTGAEILCLVRAGEGQGMARIWQSLERHGLSRDGIGKRVTPIAGDLAREGLGLGRAEIDGLARRVGTILHCGATVSYVHPYAELRAANVMGTRELLRLASRAGGIPFHFISSLAVCCPTDTSGGSVAYEADLPATGAWLELGAGYAKTKWVAERLVRTAGERGLPVAIYRPGMLMGPVLGPGLPFDDLVLRMVSACLEAGAAPDLELDLDLTPVDHASAAIATLASRKESRGTTFHVCNPEPVRWLELVAWLVARGARLDLVPFPQWLGRLETCESGRALLPFLAQRSGRGEQFVMQRYAEVGFPRFDDRNARRALAGTGIACPPGRLLLSRYFTPLLRKHALRPAHAHQTTSALSH